MRIYLISFFIIIAFAHQNAFAKGNLKVFVFKGSDIVNKGVISVIKKENNRENLFSAEEIVDGEVLFSLSPGEYQMWFGRKLKKSAKPIFVNVADNAQTQVVFDLKDPDYGKSKPLNLFEERSLEKIDFKNSEAKEVTGVVYSKQSGSPVSGALVVIKGTSVQAKSDENGVFKIPVLKNKNLNVAVIHSDFSTRQIKGVNANNWDSLAQVSLSPTMGEMEEFIVLAPQGKGSLESLLKERKAVETVSDFIGAEQIAKTGDSTAGSALKRVTGLSLVNGQFVYIRGLGERYSSTVLNKATLPSPDPSRKVVPLDMFPTSLIESISVQKSFSVDRSAEFSAGVVEIRTNSIPDRFEAGVSISTNFSSTDVMNGTEEGLFYRGGDRDLTGFDDGSRDVPDLIKESRETGKRIEAENPFDDSVGFPDDERQAFGRSFSNNYDISRDKVQPGFGLSLNLGDRFEKGVNKAGGLIKASYNVSRDSDLLDQNLYELQSEELGLRKERQDLITTTEERVNLGALLTGGVEFFKSQKLSLTGILSRSTSNTAQRIDRDQSFSDDTLFQISRLIWRERELGSFQLKGEHHFRENFKGPKLEWLLSSSRAKMDEPDRREYFYNIIDGVPTFSSSRSFSNSRIFSNLEDDAEDAQVKFSFAVGEGKFSWKPYLGAAFSGKDRLSTVQRFRFADEGFDDRETPATDPLGNQIDGENINPDGFVLVDSTEDTDNYRASALNRAYFFSNSFNYQIKEDSSVSLYAGVRVEDHDQDVELFSIFTAEESVANDISFSERDSFPAAGVNVAFNKKSSFRLGYSETISRPDFKELAPANYFNNEEDIIERGNANLVSAYVKNYDLRYDYYLSAGEVISAGVFYKDIQDPIETTRIITTDIKRTFQNVPEAQVQGIELDSRLSLRRIHKYLGGLYFTTNYAIIDSTVDLSETNGAETSKERPLQGMSAYLLNMGLEYENRGLGLNTALSFNVAGRRISEVGESGAPDVYEQPFEQLDFTFRKRIAKNKSLNFKIRNLLDSTLRRTQGSLPVRTIQDGTAYSLSISAKL